MRSKFGICLLWAVAVGLVLVSSTRAAQPGLSAQLNVLHAEVDVQANGAANWIRLRPGVQTAFGPGDRLRTSHTGRAYLKFANAYEMLVLPDTTFGLLAFGEDEARQISFAAWIDGHVIQHNLADAGLGSYQLQVGQMIVSHPADLFAAWSGVQGYDVLTVAQGTAEYETGATVRDVTATEGLLVRAAGHAFSTDMETPFNAARLIGAQSTCTGQIQNGGEANLNVRAAPALGSSVIGNIADQSVVPIMGVNERGNWYRIQVVTGFGWVRAALVENDCMGLTVLPNDSLENNVEMFEVSEQELAFLEPFYGQADSNVWFYRSFAGA